MAESPALPLIRTAFAFAWIALTGALWLHALGLRRRRPYLRAAQPAMDFAIGAVALAIAWVVAAPFGWHGGPWLPWLAPLPPIAILVATRGRRAAQGRAEPRAQGRPNRLRSALPIALLAFVAFGLAARAYTTPMYIDGRYIWAFKAKVMFADGRLDPETFTSLARYRYTALDHPLALPAVEAFVYQAIGAVDERSAKLTGVVYWLGIALLLTCFLRPRIGAPWATGLALVSGTIPLAVFYAGAGGADVPLAFHFLAAGVLLAEYAEGGRAEDGILAALLFGTGGVIKSEGIAMAIGGALALAILWVRKRPGAEWRHAGYGAAALTLPVLPWLALRAYWGIPSPQLGNSVHRSLAQMLGRMSVISQELWARATDLRAWEGCWLLIAVGLLAWVLARARPRAAALLWAILLWQFLVDVAVYLTNPYDIHWTLWASLDRLLLQLIPLGIAAAAYSLGGNSAEPTAREAS